MLCKDMDPLLLFLCIPVCTGLMPSPAASYSLEIRFVAPGMGELRQKLNAFFEALSAAAAKGGGSSAAASASLLNSLLGPSLPS